MTFDAKETSVQDGRPIELYEFKRVDQRWYYTSADRNLTTVLEDEDYTAAAISRTEIEQGQELARSPMTVTVPRNLAIADYFRAEPPSRPIFLKVRQYHESDDNINTIWTGRCLSVEWADSHAMIHCEPTITSLNRQGLRRFYQRQCPHVLYGPECRLDQADHKIVGAIDSVSGNVVNISECAGFADGWFAGGWIEHVLDESFSTVERRFIVSHVGANLTLNFPLPAQFVVGYNMTIYKGCDHTAATCNSAKFSNIANYGGFPYFPIKNPFGGAPLF